MSADVMADFDMRAIYLDEQLGEETCTRALAGDPEALGEVRRVLTEAAAEAP